MSSWFLSLCTQKFPPCLRSSKSLFELHFCAWNSLLFAFSKMMVKHASDTSQSRRREPWAAPVLQSLGRVPFWLTFLPQRVGGPPELCKFSHFSVGGCRVRLEKGLSILCDPSHDKIALPLQTSALALRLQFTRLSCQIHSHPISKRI